MKKITPTIILLLFFGCETPQQKADTKSEVVKEERDPSKVYNLMNEELPARTFTEATRKKFEKNLAIAQANYNANPDSLENIIWYGRRLGYLGRYSEAIDAYSKGINIYPSSYHLRRHRGHLFISTRQIDKAIEDFEMAAYYSLNAENRIEPDGLPNSINKPLSNDKFNIWYHFGLAYYLKGRYDKALSAYNKCMEFSDNNDLLVATSYWQYLTYKKLGNNELAIQTLQPINSKMKLIENDAYLDLLLLFKGEKPVDKLVKKASQNDNLLDPTRGYGIGSYYQHNGRFEKANEIFLRVLESPSWHSFGYIATEAELKATFPVP